MNSGDCVTTWLVDTRQWSKDEEVELAVRESLKWISKGEIQKFERMRLPKDAYMVLASALLKRAFIRKKFACTELGRDIQFIGKGGDNNLGKPCYAGSSHRYDEAYRVDFNVSHQAGLVALVGVIYDTQYLSECSVGVDLVCVNERNESSKICSTGLHAWLAQFTGILHYREIEKVLLEAFNHDAGESTDRGLRLFYAHFACREAYVKMTGDGLSAPWLSDLEFRNVRAPLAHPTNTWGERYDHINLFMHDLPIPDVGICIHALEKDYLLAIATKPAHLARSIRQIDIEKLDIAQLLSYVMQTEG